MPALCLQKEVVFSCGYVLISSQLYIKGIVILCQDNKDE
ncbi:unnamed protein product [Prunus brigantina]